MPQSGVQFHATFDELCAIVAHLASQPDIGWAVTFLDREAKAFREASPAQWRNVISESSGWSVRFWSESPAGVAASGARGSHLHPGPDLLVLHAGYMSAFGLSESCLGYRTESVELVEKWSPIVQRVRKAMMTGVWHSHPKATERTLYRELRFTSGALRLYREGVRMQQFHQYDNGQPVAPVTTGCQFEPKREVDFRI